MSQIDRGSAENTGNTGNTVEPEKPAGADDPIRLDARGLRCPLPVIRLAAAARNAPAGTAIIVLATDPAARHDIPAWCRMRGHEMREMTEESGKASESEKADSSGRTDEAEPAGTGAATTEGEHPAYLRFVVLIQP